MKKILMSMILLFPVLCFSQETASYLILNDIGEYKYRPKRTTETYGNSGVLIPIDHFDLDHNDTAYGARYVHPVTILGVEVQVTKHTDPNDSLKWLLHEVEDGYRDPDVLEANWSQGARVRDIDGNLIFGVRGSGYTWQSGNSIVVNVEYTDLTGTKPEPLEVVKAYLQKFPSSITLTDAEAKTRVHSERWIKDEMDRRLWLCDKWFMQLQLKKAEEKQVYQEAVKSMTIFLNYREKYYGIKAADEKNLLAGYLNTNNGTGIKAKLTEYKNWWTVNKDKAISL